MDIPIKDRDRRAVGEKALTTSGAEQVPADRQARLHRAMTSKSAGVALLMFLGVVVVAGGAL